MEKKGRGAKIRFIWNHLPPSYGESLSSLGLVNTQHLLLTFHFFFFFLRYLFKSQLRSIHGLQIVGLESVIRKENLAFELHELSPSQHCDYLQY